MYTVSSFRQLSALLIVLFGLFSEAEAADSSDLALIIGCTVGGFLVLVLFVLLICLAIRTRRDKDSHRQALYNGYVHQDHQDHKPYVISPSNSEYSPAGSGLPGPVESNYPPPSMISSNGLPHGVWASNPSMFAQEPAPAYMMSRPDKQGKPDYRPFRKNSPREYDQGSSQPKESWYNKTMRAMKNLPSVFQVKRSSKKTLAPQRGKAPKAKSDKSQGKRLPRTTTPEPGQTGTKEKNKRPIDKDEVPPPPNLRSSSPTVAVAFNYFYGQEELPERSQEEPGTARVFSDYPALHDIPEDDAQEEDLRQPSSRPSTRDRRKEHSRRSEENRPQSPSHISHSEYSLHRHHQQAGIQRSGSNVSKRSLPTGPTQGFPYGVAGFHTKQPSLFVASSNPYGKGVFLGGGSQPSHSLDRAQAKAKKDKHALNQNSNLIRTDVGFAPDGSLIRPTQTPAVFVASQENSNHYMKHGKASSALGLHRDLSPRRIPEPDYHKPGPETKPKSKHVPDQPLVSQSQPNVFFKTKTASEFMQESEENVSKPYKQSKSKREDVSRNLSSSPTDSYMRELPAFHKHQSPEPFQKTLPNQARAEPVELWPMPTLEKRVNTQPARQAAAPPPIRQVAATDVSRASQAAMATEQPISWQEVKSPNRPISRGDGISGDNVAEAFKFLENYENEMSFDED